jgi:hypothetical protein
LSNPIEYIITIGGHGERMKCISPIDKHLLYYRDKRIIDWILSIVPSAQIIGSEKTKSRKETLLSIEEKENVCIIDCDIIPFGLDAIEFSKDTILCFQSNKTKYSSLIVKDGIVLEASENDIISNTKCSGVYYVKSVKNLLAKMKNHNSISEAMIGSAVLYEDTFLRMGDAQDYMESI